MSNELTDVRCPCGAEFQADSYDAGFIAGSGMCQNCDAALPPKDICTCPSGDGSLVHPCPAHPAPAEQAGGDERAAFERAFTVQEGICFDDKRGEYRSMNLRAIEATDAQDLNLRLQGWQARAALASTPVADESPMAKMADALREKARQEQQAYQDRRNQATEWGPMPEGTEADRLISTDPVAHVAGDETSRYLEWAKDRSAWEMPVGTPVYYAALAQPCPARPEVVAFIDTATDNKVHFHATAWDQRHRLNGAELMTVAQHDRIVGELRADRDSWAEQAEQRLADWDEMRKERDAALAKVERLRESKGDPSGSFDRCMKMMYERDENAKRLDAALARVAELEKGTVYVEARQCDECQHVGINDSADGLAACHDCDWTGPEPDEDKCPDCQRENCMAAACPQCGARYVLVASEEIAAPVAQAQHSVPVAREQLERLVRILDAHNYAKDAEALMALLAAAPGKEVPQAWLDVQAERRRQVEAEGWTGQA
ncbi:hypothetical protein ACV334_02515 [Pseudomonas aeruginosa]